MKAVTKRGYVKLADSTFDVFVLENGMRVCTQRTFVRALGGSGGNLDRPLGKKTAGAIDLGTPVTFDTLDGVQALGRQVGDIGRICAQIIDAQINGVLPPEKIDLARAANRLNGALATVALEALVDEATGYQQVREGDYLRQRLHAFLRDDADRWRRMFGPGLIDALCQLYSNGRAGARLDRLNSAVCDKLYRHLIGRDITEALRERNPSPRFGRNHHQYFTGAVQAIMVTDLVAVEALARTSRTPKDFWAKFMHHFKRTPLQMGFE